MDILRVLFCPVGEKCTIFETYRLIPKTKLFVPKVIHNSARKISTTKNIRNRRSVPAGGYLFPLIPGAYYYNYYLERIKPIIAKN